MRNVQERIIEAPAEAVGLLVDGLSGPGDLLWPVPAWPALELDRGLTPGSTGGHGPIRYTVVDVEPGRLVRLDFAPETGLVGSQEFEVQRLDDGTCRLVHTIDSELRGAMRLRWPLVVRWLHEALMQDLFDNAERLVDPGRPRPTRRWSPWVRVLRWALARSRRRRTTR